MFQVYGQQGRIFSGSLEELRQLPQVLAVSRLRRLTPVASGPEPLAPDAGPVGPGGQGSAEQQAMAAYAGLSQHHARHPLIRVADVMHRPAYTVAASATLREAWHTLARHGIGQAPVVGDDGALVGLVGRAELLPPAMLERMAIDPAAWQAMLAQPVVAVMWSPVPSTTPETELRRVAAMLLGTGLPGVPVADDSTGQVLGFVSRTDLLRALVTEPPLDLWG